MKREEFVKKVYVSDLEGSHQRGRPLDRLRDRAKEYTCEWCDSRRGGCEQARRDCMDRERWRLSSAAISWGDVLGGNKASERDSVMPQMSLILYHCVNHSNKLSNNEIINT